MSYEDVYSNFAQDKREFYSSVNSFEEARKRAQNEKHDYGFVAPNEKSIRDEFNLLISQLRQGKVNESVFWFYLYYCCILLQTYHRAYDQKDKAKEFLRLRVQIKHRSTQNPYPKTVNNDSFFAYLADRISKGLEELAKIPQSTTKMKEQIGLANISRIYWFFCRTAIAKSLHLARDIKWIDKLATLLDKDIDVDNIVGNLETPNELLRFLSVGFFAARFIINAGLLIKHVFFPTEEEKKLDMKKLFFKEIYARHGALINDFVWGTVNLITNYNEVFHISAAHAPWIVAGFLFFDFCLILWLHHLAEQEYMSKRLQLVAERDFYQTKLNQLPNFLNLRAIALSKLMNERDLNQKHWALLNEQIKGLDLSWQAKSSTFYFNACAALLLMTGFTASMIFTAPLMVLACYVICTFAAAMYLSDATYHSYVEKKLELQQAKLENKDLEEAQKNYQEARNEYISTLAKNFLMPAIFVATYALCWQAALVLTAAYVGYQLYSEYKNYTSTKEQEKGVVLEESSDDSLAVGCFG